jgi:hypothetical protein
MKNNFLTAILLTSSSLGLLAQPTLNTNSSPSVGFTYSTSQVDLGSTLEGPAGANVTWDFSSLQDTGAVNTFNFVDPSGLPDASSFPTATIAYSGLLDGVDFSAYLRNSATSFELLGSAISSPFGNFVIPYTDPMKLFSFPTTFNSSYSDTYRSDFTADLGFASTTTTTTGTMSYEVDGYGTLITSSGTYNNVLRMKKYDVSFDTSFTSIAGEEQPPAYSESRSLSYEWVVVANGESIPVFVITTDTSITEFEETYSRSASHSYSEEFTGLKSNQATDFMMFPNPTEGKFVATVSNQIREIQICDITGKTVLTFAPDADQLNDVQEFDITNLPAGIYWVRQIGANTTLTKKLVRQ